MKGSDGITVIPCPVCGKPASHVVNAQEEKRVGWYCAHCRHFEKAILRERVLEPEAGKP